MKLALSTEVKVKALREHTNKVDMEEVFYCLDRDDDGLISMIDLRMAWARFLNISISPYELRLLWTRFKWHKDLMVNFKNFISATSLK